MLKLNKQPRAFKGCAAAQYLPQ